MVIELDVMPIRSSDGLNSVLFAATGAGLAGATRVVVWPFFVVVVMTLPLRTTVETLVPSLRSWVVVVGAVGPAVAGAALAGPAAVDCLAAGATSNAVGGGGVEVPADAAVS